jgi:hypothetical protein
MRQRKCVARPGVRPLMLPVVVSTTGDGDVSPGGGVVKLRKARALPQLRAAQRG